MSFLDSLDKLRSRGTGKWQSCCPVHSDKTPSLSIKQNDDDTYIIYCHGCGANGVDVFRALGLDLDELFAYKDSPDYKKPVITRQQEAYLKEDKIFIEIYDAAKTRGDQIKLTDHKRYKLAVHRKSGLEAKING